MILTWFENFDNDTLVVLGVYTFVNFRVLASANLLDDLIVLLRPNNVIAMDYLPKFDFKVLVVRIGGRHLLAHIWIILWQIHFELIIINFIQISSLKRCSKNWIRTVRPFCIRRFIDCSIPFYPEVIHKTR